LKRSELLLHPHIIEETLISGRTMLQETTVMPLTSLSEDVGAGVPEDSLAFRIIHIQKLNTAILLQGTIQIPLGRIDLFP
jgi:hypothetical protein